MGPSFNLIAHIVRWYCEWKLYTIAKKWSTVVKKGGKTSFVTSETYELRWWFDPLQNLYYSHVRFMFRFDSNKLRADEASEIPRQFISCCFQFIIHIYRGKVRNKVYGGSVFFPFHLVSLHFSCNFWTELYRIVTFFFFLTFFPLSFAFSILKENTFFMLVHSWAKSIFYDLRNNFLLSFSSS